MSVYDQQQQILADQLRRYQAQAQTQAPQGRMAGRVYVAPNALEYLAAGLRGVGGMRGEQQTQQAMTDLQAKRQKEMAELLAGFSKDMAGTPYNPGTQGLEEFGRASIPEQAATPSDPMAAFGRLSASQFPEFQKMGMQGMAAMPEMQARQQERVADRTFRADQAAAERQARAEQLAATNQARADQLAAAAQARAEQAQMAHQLRMDQMAAQNASAAERAAADREFRAEQMKLQQDFTREMKKIGGAVAGAQPYFQQVPTAQGIGAFNTRTGEIKYPTGPGGAPIVGAAADPKLQGDIAGAKTGAQTAAKLTTEARIDAPKAIQQGEDTIKLVDDLLKAPGFKQAVGGSRLLQVQRIPGTSAKDFDIRLDQLKGQQFLQAFESLKGGGHITEVEGKKATDAIARMDAAGSEKEFVNAAREFQATIRTGVERARKAQSGGATTPPAAPKRIRLDAQGNVIP
jgi:hypothetical protein